MREGERRFMFTIYFEKNSSIFFQPVKFNKIDKNFYVTIEDTENEKAITVVNGENKNTRVCCTYHCPKRVGSFRYSTDFLLRKTVRSDNDLIRKL